VGEFEKALAGATLPLLARIPMGRARVVFFATTFVLVLAAVAVIASHWVPRSRIDPSLVRVVALPLENLTGDPSLDNAGSWAAGHVTSGLWEAGLTQVVKSLDVAVSANETTAEGEPLRNLERTWPETFAATLGVLGQFYALPAGDSIEFRLHVEDREGTVREMVTPVRGARENLDEALTTLQTQVVMAVARIVAPGSQEASLARGRRPPKREAYLALVEGWTEYARDQEASIPILQRAIAADSLFFRPLIVLHMAYRVLDQYAQADSICQIIEKRIDEADRVGRLEAEYFCPNVRTPGRTELEASRRLAELVPGHSYLLGLTLLSVNRPGEAADAFARWDTARGTMAREWEDTNGYYWAMALHLLGEHSKALKVVRDVRSRFPDHSGLVWQEVGALVALGQKDEAETVIEGELARRSPGYDPFPLLYLAGLESNAHGRQEEAREFWERALGWYGGRPAEQLESWLSRLRRTTLLLCLERIEDAEDLVVPWASEFPDDPDALGLLGVLRAKQGDRVRAEAAARALAAWDPPVPEGLGPVLRAYIAAQLGDREEAIRLLEQAMEKGWTVMDNLHTDPLLEPLWGYPAFETFRRPKG
jgi:tetratricopeptide (TPR) repeat protein